MIVAIGRSNTVPSLAQLRQHKKNTPQAKSSSSCAMIVAIGKCISCRYSKRPSNLDHIASNLSTCCCVSSRPISNLANLPAWLLNSCNPGTYESHILQQPHHSSATPPPLFSNPFTSQDQVPNSETPFKFTKHEASRRIRMRRRCTDQHPILKFLAQLEVCNVRGTCLRSI